MIMIQERYCSFEVAKLLKEKGFKESTQFVWYEHLPSPNAAHNSEIGKPKRDYFYWEEESECNSSWTNDCLVPSYISGDVYSCPTHQSACDWLRQQGYNIEVIAILDDNKELKWTYKIQFFKQRYSQSFVTTVAVGVSFDDKKIGNKTYEEAMEEGIKHCLTYFI